MRPIAIFILCFSLLCNLGCSVNILENFADKTTNEAKFANAKILINSGDYDGAIDVIDSMTGSYAARREVIALKATAYGGLCGLNTIQFSLAMTNLGSSLLLPFLLNHFRAGATSIRADNCKLAEDLIESIGDTAAERSTDENLLLTLISFAKIGNILSQYADANQDGTAENGTDICTTGNMPDTAAREFGTGFTLAAASIAQLGSTIEVIGSAGAAIADICSNGTFSALCAKVDPAGFSAAELLALRSLAQEGAVMGLNLGTCGGGNVASSVNCRCFP